MSETINILKQKQLKEFGEEGLKYISSSKQLDKYIIRKSVQSENSAKTYRAKLNRFGFFIYQKYGKASTLDEILSKVATGEIDPYDLLAEFAAYLKEINVKPNEIRQKTKMSRKFLRFCGAKINNEDFTDNVPLPKSQTPEFNGVEKAQIVEILNYCKNQRLKTAIMLYAATGCRAVEGCAVRLCDINFENNTITFRKEYTKTKRERIRPMTRELAKQIQIWLKEKYRIHWAVRVAGGKREKVEPKPNPEDLLLGFWHHHIKSKPEGVYDSIYHEYQVIAELMEMKRKNGRRLITFHRLRAFAKSTISDLGYGDYSEWFIGHSGSTYYRKPEKERIEVFRKVEQYLTFLDVTGFEAKGADQQTKIEQLQADLQEEREERKRLLEQLYKQGVIKKD